MGAFKVAHQYYSDFFTNDAWDEEKAQAKVGKYYTDERVEYIRKFYETLLNSKKMNEVGLMYIKHSNLSVRKVVELYNEGLKESKRENPNTVKSRIILCANKINNSFEEVNYIKGNKEITSDPLELIMTARIVPDSMYKAIKEAENQIDKFVEMFDTSKNRNENLLIRIPAYAKVAEIGEDEWNDFFDIIRPYSKREMKAVETRLIELRNAVGYFNFIMTPGVKLSEIDKERRDILLRWMGRNPADKIEDEDLIVEDYKLELEESDNNQEDDSLLNFYY